MLCLGLEIPSSLRKIEACVKVAKLFRNAVEDILIIHHWDTDGVASAAAIIRLLINNKVLTDIPRIGVYDSSALRHIKVDEEKPILMLDYGINPLEAAKVLPKDNLLVIDHHAVDPQPSVSCNPVAERLGGELRYPATAKVIYDLAGDRGVELRDLAVLGIVGDLGPKAANALSMCSKELATELSDEELRLFERASDIIDACYRLIKPEMIKHAVKVLANEGVKGVIEDKALLRNYYEFTRISREALDHLEKVYVKGLIEVYDLRLNAYLTSFIGRLLARRNSKGAIILRHQIDSLGLTYVYIRSYSISMASLRNRLARLGYRVGGKDYVVVVTCKEKKCTELTTSEAVRYLYLKTSGGKAVK